MGEPMSAPSTRSRLLGRLNAVAHRVRTMALALGVVQLLLVWLPIIVLLAYIDWNWDLVDEIPLAGRLLITLTALGSFVWLVRRLVVPAVSLPSTTTVANLVEQRWPELDFRLTTTVQVHDDGPFAQKVITEAEALSANKDWHEVVDVRPLWLATRCLLPLLGILTIWSILHSYTPLVLFHRVVLFSQVPIPRSTWLGFEASVNAPQGEPVQVVLSWAGKAPEGGLLRWRGTDGQKIELPVEIAEGQVTATLPADAGDGVIRVWAGDGRAGPVTMTRKIRPVPVLVSARAVLPAWLGTNPKGNRYSQDLADGEAEALPGSDIEVSFEAGIPLSDCQITVFPANASAEPRQIGGTISESGTGGTVRFMLSAGDARYEIQTVSSDNLLARPPLTRRCRPLPEDPPQVVWMAEHIASGASKDDVEEDLDGLPVVIGSQFRVAYRAASPAGLAGAEFQYRIVDKSDWRTIKLTETVPGAEWGTFDSSRGVFARRSLGVYDFYPAPSADLASEPGRREAWGRFDFHIEGLKELRLGDRIEYKVVVRDQRPAPLRGESETRIKEVVGVDELLAWLRRREREQEKLRQLRLDQLGVFPDRPATRSGS